MKKILIIVFSAALAILIAVVCFCFSERDPDKILKTTLLHEFNIDMRKFNYKITHFDESWHSTIHGDGHLLIIFKLSELTNDNISQLNMPDVRALPISNELFPYELPQRFMTSSNGLYTFKKITAKSKRSYVLFIIDKDLMEGVLCCNIL